MRRADAQARDHNQARDVKVGACDVACDHHERVADNHLESSLSWPTPEDITSLAAWIGQHHRHELKTAYRRAERGRTQT